MKTFKAIALFMACVAPLGSHAQGVATLSLQEAVALAQGNSLDYKVALNTIQSNYWNYQTFRSGFLPRLTLNGVVPRYFRAINQITLPNGENSFVVQNFSSSNLNLNVSQNIGLTGGRVSVSSSLARIDNFGGNRFTTYSTAPLFFSYSQSSLFYNSFRWQKKIEPLKYEEAQRDYVERLENIAYRTVDRYFTLLLASTQLRLDRQNLQNIDTLVKVTQARAEIGIVQLNEALQAKVSLLNARKAVANSILNLETAKQDLIRYLSLDRDLIIELQQPEDLLFFDVNPAVALQQALQNRKAVVEFQRRRLQAEQEIARTRAETGPTVSFGTNFGLSQTGSELGQSYQNMLNSQTLELGFSVPILDWGVNKSSRKRAEANLELEKILIEQEELAIEQEIYLQSMKWAMVREQMEIAKETRDLAGQRYEVARQKYSLGSISYTDFNNAQLDKDSAAKDYIKQLHDYWSLYYLIRKLTLYDFQGNKKLEVVEPIFD